MQLVSVVVMAIALYTITAMFFGKRSPTLVFIIGVLGAFLVANLVPDGMDIVMNDVGLRQSNVFSLNAWTIFVSVFAQRTWWIMIIVLVFLITIGLSVERRTNNMKYCFLVFGGLILGVVFWCLLVDTTDIIGGPAIAVASIIGAGFALFPRLRVFLPVIGDTKIQIWMIVVFWWAVSVVTNLLMMPYDVAIMILLVQMTAFIFGFVLGMISKMKNTPWTLYEKWELHIDPEQIEHLCITDKQMETYARLMEIEDPYMRDAWIKVLVASLNCPQCGGSCMVISNKVVCDKGHYVSQSHESEQDFIS